MEDVQKTIRIAANNLDIPKEFIDLLFLEDLPGIYQLIDNLCLKDLIELPEKLILNPIFLDEKNPSFENLFKLKLKGVMSPVSFLNKAIKKMETDAEEINDGLINRIQDFFEVIAKRHYSEIIKDIYRSGTMSEEEIRTFPNDNIKKEFIEFSLKCLINRERVIVDNLKKRFTTKRLKEILYSPSWDESFSSQV